MDRSSFSEGESQRLPYQPNYGESDISDELFERFAGILAHRTGISLKLHKKYLLVNRLSRWIGRGHEYDSFEAYYKALLQDSSGALMEQFVNALTTNYSFFFRDVVHFEVLGQYAEERAAAADYFRFWSAASSTGEEAFSIAMTLLKCGQRLPADTKILATDISTKVLGQASTGRFPISHVQRSVSPSDFARFFYPDNRSGFYQAKDEVRNLITFRHLNLLQPYPLKKPMDIIFLRNVLIYFGNDEKELVVNKMSDYLKPGGLLLIGLSESLVGIRHPFKMLRNSIYQKVKQ
jgi:chemotaxis protein methyltransferase CheR